MVYGLKLYLDEKEVTDKVLDLVPKGQGMTMKSIMDLGSEPDFIKALSILPCSHHRYYHQTGKMLEQE